jgi:hypothetical protein
MIIGQIGQILPAFYKSKKISKNIFKKNKKMFPESIKVSKTRAGFAIFATFYV